MISITVLSIILTKVVVYYTNGKIITQYIRRIKNEFSRTELISKSFFVVCLTQWFSTRSDFCPVDFWGI